MSTLTKKQAEVLSAIRRHLKSRGYAPSYREIGEAVGLSSPATVHQHVKSLLDKGVIRMGEEGETRSIELVEEEKAPRVPSLLLPLMGLITAGVPIEAVEQNETMD